VDDKNCDEEDNPDNRNHIFICMTGGDLSVVLYQLLGL
jgi:hypothetical protein